MSSTFASSFSHLLIQSSPRRMSPPSAIFSSMAPAPPSSCVTSPRVSPTSAITAFSPANQRNIGRDFSRTMPSPYFGLRFNQQQHQTTTTITDNLLINGDDDDHDLRPFAGDDHPKRTSTHRRRSLKKVAFAASASYIEFMPQQHLVTTDIDWDIGRFTDPAMVLEQLNMSKYLEKFVDQEIDMEAMLLLSDSDLQELGVTTIGARKKLSYAIKKLRESSGDH